MWDEHSWSTQHGSLITTGALCHVFWVHWEHSCPSEGMEHLFRPFPGAPWHVGSTLPCIISTLATLFRAMLGQFCREHSPMYSETRWDHSSLRWWWNYAGSTLPCNLSPHGSTLPCILRLPGSTLVHSRAMVGKLRREHSPCMEHSTPISRSTQPWRLSKPGELHRTLHGTLRPVVKHSGSTRQCILSLIRAL